MGVRQKEMVKARLFRTPFAELRNRHVFLERRGLYRTPHKGQSQSGNPALRDVLRPTEGDFVAGVARASPDEYEVFKRLLAREEEEMEEEEEEDEDEEDGRPRRGVPGCAAPLTFPPDSPALFSLSRCVAVPVEPSPLRPRPM